MQCMDMKCMDMQSCMDMQCMDMQSCMDMKCSMEICEIDCSDNRRMFLFYEPVRRSSPLLFPHFSCSHVSFL